ncbi:MULTISPECIES: hypothetical protein [Thermoprotei]|uniref:hypothetical protein n=1 Tax=Thermoprotei TaxID=183924 RepID=UPI00279BCF59|nr:hypothetical protein SSRV2_ORF44 [Saccharolobus shibatae rod virus 2]
MDWELEELNEEDRKKLEQLIEQKGSLVEAISFLLKCCDDKEYAKQILSMMFSNKPLLMNFLKTNYKER